jgi:hypothetical protein
VAALCGGARLAVHGGAVSNGYTPGQVVFRATEPGEMPPGDPDGVHGPYVAAVEYGPDAETGAMVVEYLRAEQLDQHINGAQAVKAALAVRARAPQAA